MEFFTNCDVIIAWFVSNLLVDKNLQNMAAEKLRQKMADLKARLDVAEARSETFKESLSEVTARIDSAEASAANLRKQATMTEVEIKRIASRLESVEGQLLLTNETLKRNEEAMSSLFKDEDQMAATQNQLNEKLESVKQTVASNETKLEEAKRRIKLVEMQKKLTEKRCERLAELEANLNEKLLQINKYIEELQSRSHGGMLSAEEEMAMKEKIEDLKNTYRESEARAQLAQRKIAALNCKRDSLEKELEDITQRKHWAQDELNKVLDEFGVTT